MTDADQKLLPFIPLKVSVFWTRSEIVKAPSPVVANFEETREFSTVKQALIFAKQKISAGEVWLDFLELRIDHRTILPGDPKVYCFQEENYDIYRGRAVRWEIGGLRMYEGVAKRMHKPFQLPNKTAKNATFFWDSDENGNPFKVWLK